LWSRWRVVEFLTERIIIVGHCHLHCDLPESAYWNTLSLARFFHFISSSMTVPSVFEPRVLRDTVKFRNLSGYEFDQSDILWLCKEICRENPKWDYQVVSIAAVSKRYHLCVGGLRLWLRLHKEKSSIPFASVCTSIDETCIDRISAKRISAWTSSGVANLDDFRQIVYEEMEKTEARRAKKSRRWLSSCTAKATVIIRHYLIMLVCSISTETR
jgi:transposase-like protein